MKLIFPVVVFLFALSGCGASSNSGKGTGDGSGKPTRKHIEAGTDLVFTCLDTFNQTTVTLYSMWNQKTSSWILNGDEVDQNGRRVQEWRNLIGTLDQLAIWQMLVTNGTAKFARIAQDGTDQATFYGGTRTISCKFN